MAFLEEVALVEPIGCSGVINRFSPMSLPSEVDVWQGAMMRHWLLNAGYQHRIYCYHDGLICSCILSVADSEARQHKIISRQFSEDDR